MSSDPLAKHRFAELDGLRGIAAAMVAVGHGFIAAMVIPAGAFGGAIIAHICGVVNGATSVDLFFIMSGFFLAGMLKNLTPGPLSSFYLRRFIRLVPPALVSVLALYIFARLTLSTRPTYPEAAPDFHDFFDLNHLLPWKIVALHLALLRHTLNPPLWTIRLEIFTSAIFPLLYFLKNIRTGMAFRAALFVVLLIIAIALQAHQKLGLDTLHYLYIFYAGALLQDYGPKIEAYSPRAQNALLIFAVLGLCITGEFVPLHNQHPVDFDLPITCFGTLLIAVLAYGGIPATRRFMRSGVIQFFGRISYSFYLIDWLSVMGIGGLIMRSRVIDQLGPFTTIWLIMVSSFAVNIVLAYALHLLAERPSVALSRRFAR